MAASFFALASQRIAYRIFAGAVLALLVACAQPQKPSATEPVSSWLPADPPAGHLIPVNLFPKSNPGGPPVAQPGAANAAASVPFVPSASPPPSPQPAWVPEVHLYASAATRDYFAKGGLDAKANQRQWEVLLRKYKIPFKAIGSVESLEAVQSGVLVLPSSVVLSQREKQAVVNFRSRGGSVMATWMTGVRSESGAWLGFNFMEKALDASVVGTTAADDDDNFMMPYGNSPVTHHLPAGLRVWLERVKEWPSLRLKGRQPSAEIMDWLRSFTIDKARSAMVFDERPQAGGHSSRSVVLGWPERLWLSADPQQLEAITLNSLRWLLRQPSAYVSAWPHPYSSGFMLTIFVVDVIGESDVKIAKAMEDMGARVTYYAMSKNTPKAAAALKALQSRGHELGYLGDDLVGFKGQSASTQAARLDNMRKLMVDSTLELSADAGFHPPMESYDKTTESLVRDRAFGHYIAYMDASDARLPFLMPPAPGAGASAKATVVLPRTQNGPEDAMEEGDPDDGLKAFLSELDLAQKMGGLSIVRMPNQSLVTDEQMADILKRLQERRSHMWMATGSQVANWWRERERVSVALQANMSGSTELTVSIQGAGPLNQPVAIWLNLPQSGGSFRLLGDGNLSNQPQIAAVDAWRSALVINGLAPGVHRWQLQFTGPVR